MELTRNDGITTLTGARRIQDAQGYDTFWGKNVIEAGCKYRIIWPIAIDAMTQGASIPVATDYGYSACSDMIGYSYVSASKAQRVGDSNKFEDTSALREFAYLANVLYDARMKMEIADLQSKMEKDAKNLGESVNPAEVKRAVEEIEARYKGVTINDQFVGPTERRFLDRPEVHIYGAPIVIPVNKDWLPERNAKVVRSTLELKKTKMDEIEKALAQVTDEDINRGYIELRYDYSADPKDRKVCGQKAKFEYINPENQLASVATDWWQINGDRIKSMFLLKDSDIRSKNRGLANPPAEVDVIANIKKYCMNKRVLSFYLDIEDDRVKANAKTLLSIGGFITNAEMRAKLQEAVAANQYSQDEDTKDDVTADEAAKLMKAETLKDVTESVTPQRFDQLFNDEQAFSVPADALMSPAFTDAPSM